MEEKNIIRVAFYLRVSTPEQVKGFGPEYQNNALNDLINYKKNQTPKWVHEKKWFYEDRGFSGGDLNRPQFNKMLEDAKNGEFDMIAVWKIDRMSRNLSHLLKTFEELKEYGVGFYSIKENIDFSGPIGRLTFQIFGALAEFEREMIKSRTIEGKIASAKLGNYIKGSAPFGYKKVGNEGHKGSKLKVIKHESEIVKKIFEWFVYEDLSYSDIMRRLNEMGVRKGEGGIRKNIEYTKWYETTVKDVLIQSAYKGYVEELFAKDGDKYPVIVPTPKIVSLILFEQAQAKIKDIEENYKGGERKYLLSGKIFDPIEMTERGTMRKFVGVKRTKGGHSYRRDAFERDNGEKVRNQEFVGKALDDYVWSHVLYFISQPEKFYKLFKKQTSEFNWIDTYREEIEILERGIEEQEIMIINIEKKELSGRLSEEKAIYYVDEANKIIANNKRKIEDLNGKIEQLLNLELTKDIIDDVSKNYKRNIEKLNDEQKRRLIDMLVDKVLVFYDDNGVKEVEVNFRFNVNIDKNDDMNIELNNGLNKTKNTSKGVVISEYGALGRIRTHDL